LLGVEGRKLAEVGDLLVVGELLGGANGQEEESGKEEARLHEGSL
jgi:hypothetical protein